MNPVVLSAAKDLAAAAIEARYFAAPRMTVGQPLQAAERLHRWIHKQVREEIVAWRL